MSFYKGSFETRNGGGPLIMLSACTSILQCWEKEEVFFLLSITWKGRYNFSWKQMAHSYCLNFGPVNRFILNKWIGRF